MCVCVCGQKRGWGLSLQEGTVRVNSFQDGACLLVLTCTHIEYSLMPTENLFAVN